MPNPADSNTEGLVSAFLQSLRLRNLSALTIKAYTRDLCDLTRRITKPVYALEAQDLQPMVGLLMRAGASPRSIRRRLAAWRSFFDWLMTAEPDGIPQLEANPAQGLRLPKVARTLPKTLSVDAACAFVQGLQTSSEGEDWRQVQDRAIYELAYGCGLRLSEIIGLDQMPEAEADSGWIDTQSRQVHVMGKGRKRRVLPLGRHALEAVMAWLSVRKTLQWPTPALFVGTRGGRLNARSVQRSFERRSREAGLGFGVHPHMLRHSFASHLLQSSGDLRAVQELLGHAHIATTQVYTHLDHQHLAKILDQAHPRAKPRSSQAK
ncbi:MAG: hypothetical protein RLZZ290_87 [Pseudomonadota bacterium]|jgi:integrase/recombinase XerC